MLFAVPFEIRVLEKKILEEHSQFDVFGTQFSADGGPGSIHQTVEWAEFIRLRPYTALFCRGHICNATLPSEMMDILQEAKKLGLEMKWVWVFVYTRR